MSLPAVGQRRPHVPDRPRGRELLARAGGGGGPRPARRALDPDRSPDAGSTGSCSWRSSCSCPKAPGRGQAPGRAHRLRRHSGGRGARRGGRRPLFRRARPARPDRGGSISTPRCHPRDPPPSQGLRGPRRAAASGLRFEAASPLRPHRPEWRGKTNCFNLLTGLLAPDRAGPLPRGRDVTRPPGPISARGSAFPGRSRSRPVRRRHGAGERAHGRAGVARAGLRLLDAGRRLAEARTGRRGIRLVGLAGREQVAAKYLSYGQRRLLEIGVALAGEPDLLLLDEPTSGLGSRPMETLRDLVQRLSAASPSW